MRTESYYIGPATSQNGQSSTKKSQGRGVSTTDKKEPSTEKIDSQHKRAPSFISNLGREELCVCPGKLKNKTENFYRQLQEIGAPCNGMRVRIKKGPLFRSKRSITGKTHTLIVNKGWTSSAKTSKEYEKVLGRMAIDAVRKGNRKKYLEMKSEFSKSYRRTNLYIAGYIMQSKDKDRIPKALNMMAFGAYSSIYKSGINKKKLGLEEGRKNWKEEIAPVVGELAMKGSKKVLAKHQSNLKKAIVAQEVCHKQLKGTYILNIAYRRRLKRDLKRSMKRVEAVKEHGRKIDKAIQILNFK